MNFTIFGVPVPFEYLIFIPTLIGVAFLHKKKMEIAIAGAVLVIAYKLHQGNFDLLTHMKHEYLLLTNLGGLLLGFELLSDYFARSRIPEIMPKYLPDDWKGGLVLLGMVFVISSFLDNIAAAMIGGTIAGAVYKKRIHIGFLAAIVAASNAGGAGSVIGDTTTTMMWIAGKSAWSVFHAYIASLSAFAVFAVIAAKQQHAYQPITADAPVGVKVEYHYLFIVGLILAGAILANIYLDFPAAGVWAGILISTSVRKADWKKLMKARKGTVFLLALVLTASMMPLEKLPTPSWHSTLGLGFISAFFDNIPLTKLALDQGGYDWGALGYAVGFGGSMLYQGSSAGVSLSNKYPEMQKIASWVRYSWHVPLGYVVGFFVLLLTSGWNPS